MVEISHIFTDEPVKLPLIQDEDVIKAFPTYTADEAFAHCVGLGNVHRGADHIDPLALRHASETRSILLIILSNQEARSHESGFVDNRSK